MPFCNRCGSPLDSTATGCPVCGQNPLTTPATPAPAAGPGASSTPEQSKRFVARFTLGVFLLGAILLTVAFTVFFHYEPSLQRSRHATVNTAFGKIAAGSDPLTVARTLHLPVYPGARGTSDDSTDVSAFGANVVTVGLVTADPLEQVVGFYQRHYPTAVLQRQGTDREVLSAAENNQVVTLVLRRDGGETRIQFAIVQR